MRILVMALVSASFLVACAKPPALQPGYTSFPVAEHGRPTEEPVAFYGGATVNLPSKVRIDNQIELGIRGPVDGPGGLERLHREVDKLGRETCAGGHAVTRAKAYTGAEATSKMLGIGGPWVAVRFRCPIAPTSLELPEAAPAEARIRAAPGSEWFDIHAHRFEADGTALLAAVQAQLAAQGETMGESDPDRRQLTTQWTRHGAYGFPSHDLYRLAIVEVSGGGSVLVFQLQRRWTQFDLQELRFPLQVPAPRDAVYQAASEFLAAVSQRLQPTPA